MRYMLSASGLDSMLSLPPGQEQDGTARRSVLYLRILIQYFALSRPTAEVAQSTALQCCHLNGRFETTGAPGSMTSTFMSHPDLAGNPLISNTRGGAAGFGRRYAVRAGLRALPPQTSATQIRRQLDDEQPTSR